MLKKVMLPLVILFTGVTVIVVLELAKPEPAPAPPPPEPAKIAVAVASAQPQTMRLSVVTQGTVAPKREISLIAEVSGRIISVSEQFVSGGYFEPQQTLLQIDDRDYQVALLRAQARLADAQRLLAEEQGLASQARREWRELGSQTANDLFMRKPQLASAKAGVAFAEADLAKAKLDIERTAVTVPFNGRVKAIYANLGQYVAAGTALADVYDSSAYEVRLPFTEKQAALIDLPFAHAQPVAAAQKLPQVILRSEFAGTAHQWQAKLVRTEAYIDPDSRTYYAIAELSTAPDSVGELGPPPGLFVDAYIEGKELDNVLRLPRQALVQRDQILILDADQRTVLKTVKVLRKTQSHVWIKVPLAAGTHIVLEKQTLTPAGTLVDPVISPVETTPAIEPEVGVTPLQAIQIKGNTLP